MVVSCACFKDTEARWSLKNAHNHTPNEWYSLNWNPYPEGSLRRRGTSLDTDCRRWTTLQLEQVLKGHSLWKHTLNCGLGIRVETCLQGVEWRLSREVTSSLGQCPRQKWHLLEQTSSPTKPWSHHVKGQECELRGGGSQATACFHFLSTSQPKASSLQLKGTFVCQTD